MERIQKQSGFSLFEMLVAMLMLSIGIIGAIATISAGVIWARDAKLNMTLGQVVQSVAVYCMEKDIHAAGAKTGTGANDIPPAECSGYFLYLDSAEPLKTTASGIRRRLVFEVYENNMHLNNRSKYDPVDTMAIDVYYRNN